ncbi:MAG: aldose epimerase family protein [Ginsengibacter sp.]
MIASKTLWGHYDNEEIYLITLDNGFLKLSLTNLGCTIVSIEMPDEKGQLNNMVLGYHTPEEYFKDPYYTGCVVGRYANRIKNSSFNIDGVEYKLAENDGSSGNHLHGGNIGFNKKVFSFANISPVSGSDSIHFNYRSVDGEEGYPGNVDVNVVYTLTDKNEVIIEYKAIADKATHINLTNHSYFNLSGLPCSALDHELTINAKYTLEDDRVYIPTGKMINVKDSNLDFTASKKVANNHNDFRGINSCYKLNAAQNTDVIKATLHEPLLNRTLTVRTTLPGLMLYTGDFLGEPFIKNQGVCLEAQFFPDSPHHASFPSTLLQPGDTYRHQTIYQFFNH